MFARMRLWWQELGHEIELVAAEEASRAWEEEQRREAEMRAEHAGTCPMCGTALDIGVTERTVGRTCPKCGYHDFSYLYQEVE